MDKYVGKKLDGRYEIKELIGYGGMAIVFRALDLAQNREVAIKVLKDEFLDNEEFKRRFRNESKAISLLSHPNIVSVYDVGFGERSQYIVMEYIDGITLKEYIRQQRVVKWKEVIHFSVQILRALQVAHDNGIVHRDVKPQNIMLLRDGSIKVMDFGIARFERDNNKTISDKALGSVHYISPEQARGEVTDPKADIYSVGIMMYEMLTGKVPFDGDTPVGIAIQHMQNNAALVRTINKEIPVGLEEIVNRAMQKDMDFRYQAASEMLKDIEELKENPDVIFGYKYLNEDGTTQYIDTVSPAVEEVVEKKSFVMPILAGIATTCVIVAVVAIFMFLRGMGDKPGEIVLDELIGVSLVEAQEKYPDLTFKIVEEVMSAKHEKGMIIETNPKGGTQIKEDAEIKVILSAGSENIVMIDVVGKKSDLAVDMLVAEGIPSSSIKLIQKESEDVEANIVISTNPLEGVEIMPDEQVILYVSMGKGDEAVEVPSVIGKDEEVGVEMLSSLKLMPVVERVESDKEKGIIVKQSIKAGEKVAEQTRITISVSTGEAPMKSVDVTAPLPADGINKEFTFTGSLDGEAAGSTTRNPSKDKSVSFKAESKKEEGTFTISVEKDGQSHEYAKFLINFKAGTAEQIGSTSLGLLVEEKVVDKNISVSVQLGGSADKTFSFNSYLDGMMVESQSANPSQMNSFLIEVIGQTGKGKLVVYVEIGGKEQTYCSYNIDFDTGSYSLTGGPNTGLLVGEEQPDPEPEPDPDSEPTEGDIGLDE